MNNTNTTPENDVLKVSDTAKAYEAMGQYNYEFIITKDRKSPNIKITFDFSDPENFNHLCGLDKLDSFDTIKKIDRKTLLNKITNGDYSDSFFQKDTDNYKTIQDRMECLLRLEEIFDSPNSIYSFVQKKYNRRTEIKGDYLIKFEKDNRLSFFCTVLDDNSQKYVGMSCFCRDKDNQGRNDYSKNHAQYYILYKAKLTIDKQGNEVDRHELFVANSFRKELEEMKEAGEIKRPTSALSSASSALANNFNNNSNNTQNFAIEPPRRQQYNITPPVLVGQAAGAIATALPLPTNPPPLFDMDKIINALENLNEKIVDTIHNFADTFKRSREQPPQDRTARGRKINLSLPFPKEKPSQERTEPVTAKSEKAQKLDFKPAEHAEKKLSWIVKEISSAKREANENNKNHEPKHHDKDQSL